MSRNSRGSECIGAVDQNVLCVCIEDQNVLQQKIRMYCVCEYNNQNVYEQRIGICVCIEDQNVLQQQRIRMYCNRGSDCMCEWRIRICVKQIIRMCESRIRMCCKNRGSECIATGDRNNLNRGSECIVCVWIGIRMHCNRGSECVATEDRNVLCMR